MKKILKIVFKNGIEEKTLHFGKKINLIVGPRGGGKTTLLHLLAAMSKQYYPLDFKKEIFNQIFAPQLIKYENGEETLINSCANIKNKDLEKNIFDSEDGNIIAQNDPVKHSLNQTKTVQKNQKIFAKEYSENEIFRPFCQKFLDIQKNIYDFVDLQGKKIDWFTILKITDFPNAESFNPIISLNYSKSSFLRKVDGLLNLLENWLKKIKENFLQFQSYLHDLKGHDSLLKNETLKNLNNQFLLQKENNQQQKTIIDLEIKRLQRIKECVNIFSKVFREIKNEIKMSQKKEAIVSDFIQKGRDFMISQARKLKVLKFNFKHINQNILLENESFEKENFEKEHELLTYRLEKFPPTGEDVFEILKSILHAPRVHEQIGKWIEKALDKPQKSNPEEKIRKALAKILVPRIKVLAEKKEYSKMSPGEKSIFGIRYKFSKMKNEIIFLDQPEDNLDNHTVASEILQLLNDQKDKQIFLVTHNANIGILTNPQSVIVADLSNSKNPYQENRTEEVIENPQAYYLEGGKDFLTQRYKKIIEKENHGN